MPKSITDPTEKYGGCNVKDNFIIEDTIETLQNLT
jgi:hypothetical protein